MFPTFLRRYLTWIIVTASAVALYAALGFLVVPRLLHSAIVDFTAKNYGRAASLGEIRFNPFTFALQMRDFSLPDSDSQPELSFTRLLVNADIATVWRRGASFREIAIEQPFARVQIRPDGTLNLDELLKPFADDSDDEPARLFIDKFAVHDGRSTFEDRTRATPFRADLKPISFELRDFSTTGKTGNRYALSGASVAGERFAWSGSFQVYPLSSQGNFEVTNLQARTVWNYLRESLPFELTSGIASLAGSYNLTSAGTPADAPLDLKVDLGNIAIAELGLKPNGAETEYVRLAKIDLDATHLDLTKRTVNIGKVRLAGGEVHAWIDAQDKINILEMFAPTATVAGPVPASQQNNADAWTLSVPDIAIAGLKVAAEDRRFKQAVALTFNPLNLRIAGYSTAPDAQLDIGVDSTLEGSGSIAATVKLAMDSPALAVHTKLTQIDLTVLQPYIAQQTSLTLLSGLLSTELDIVSDANGVLTVKGDSDIAKLRTIDNALKEDLIRWEHLQLTGLDYRSQPARLTVASVAARQPYARVIVAPDRSVNISKALNANAAATAADESTASKETGKNAAPAKDAMAVAIGAVRIVNGSANFADFWIQPNFAISMQGLNGNVTGLSSKADTRAKVELEGKVDRYAPARIWGEMNPLAATAFSDIQMNFKNVEMTTATPYSGRFAGYKIEKGKISADLRYKVENRSLNADHRIVIDQLQLGEKVDSPDAVHLPLKLAVALLKDRNGVIDVGLPVTGSLDDPQFRVGPIIWKAVLNLLTKVVTAPFAMLGNLVGGGEEMNLIDFDPGSAALDAAGRDKLTALVKALKERPQLELNVPIVFAAELDGPAIGAQRLKDKLLALKRSELEAKKRPSDAVDATLLADQQEHLRLLVAQHRADLGKDTALPPLAAALQNAGKKQTGTLPAPQAAITELEETLLARMPIGETELQTLGKQRAQAIQDALLGAGEIDVSRVFIINGPPKAADGAKIRVEMSLK